MTYDFKLGHELLMMALNVNFSLLRYLIYLTLFSSHWFISIIINIEKKKLEISIEILKTSRTTVFQFLIVRVSVCEFFLFSKLNWKNFEISLQLFNWCLKYLQFSICYLCFKEVFWLLLIIWNWTDCDWRAGFKDKRQRRKNTEGEAEINKYIK